jgi:hypothetical protein
VALFGQWKYGVDRDATIVAYGKAELGGADTCTCIYCRNFRIARSQTFPSEFLKLLNELGIDSCKDAEVYHNAQLSPGMHFYAGWYHFVGTLEETGDFPTVDFGGGFSAWLRHASAPRLSSLEGVRVVQLEFTANAVPWLLDEPEPT